MTNSRKSHLGSSKSRGPGGLSARKWLRRTTAIAVAALVGTTAITATGLTSTTAWAELLADYGYSHTIQDDDGYGYADVIVDTTDEGYGYFGDEYLVDDAAAEAADSDAVMEAASDD
ncbi:MAG: hypothetical protein FWG25_06150, partial [Promicromonosporaceae bacterium]|nr:hypothetical protein [Promicromonosporaceae bacterium]